MGRPLSRLTGPVKAGPVRQAGITLVEVLVAILITGIGLLALLALFPLGALEMAQAIKDDRTAAVAADAVTLSKAGEDLLSRTAEFVVVSLSEGSADPQTASQLREEYEDLAVQAADLEVQLRELQSLFPRSKIQRHLARLLAQIRLIKLRIDTLIKFLSLLEKGEVVG
ncbi:MAG: prepilin-type N-terminal cleavage/methylation domain-containing protein [Deltaproteobacteria bacterium]|nr:prepilin-type N-terminal cleavage/methylation domain-containing protein [Deltaproteobacteria bacterium]